MPPYNHNYPPMEQLILETFADRCAKETGQTGLFLMLLQDKAPAKTIVEQLTDGTNTLLYDTAGLPSLMVRVPYFSLDQVIPGAGSAAHPMFCTRGAAVKYVYLSKYQNITEMDRAYSLPDQAPRTFISYDEALEACGSKGPGWHLMTNYEWAGIALWCRFRGIIPRGNNSNGSDCNYGEDTCTLVPELPDSPGGPALTGSGPVSWAHDHTINGIFDCNGNVAEWTGGLRMKDGKLLWLMPEHASRYSAQLRNSPFWRAMQPDGQFVPEQDAHTLHFDYTSPPPPAGGTPEFSLALSCDYPQKLYEKPVPDMDTTYGHMPFADFSSRTELSEKALQFLQAACVFPMKDGCAPGDLYFRNHGEMAALRGGHWYHRNSAGMFWLNLAHRPGYSARRIGFRCAWIPPETI